MTSKHCRLQRDAGWPISAGGWSTLQSLPLELAVAGMVCWATWIEGSAASDFEA
jgi:hypothetical protein